MARSSRESFPRTEKEFLVGQRFGVMRFPKQHVAGTFNSMREAYKYQVQQLPGRDCEERMKLADGV